MPYKRKLINYVPPKHQKVENVAVHNVAEQPEFEKAFVEVDKAYNNRFIATSDERGIRAREKMLKIIPSGSDTLEDRRFRLFARWTEQIPITRISLRRSLDSMLGADSYNIEYYPLDYKVLFIAESWIENRLKDIYDYLRRSIPLNYGIVMMLVHRATQHQYAAITTATHENQSLTVPGLKDQSQFAATATATYEQQEFTISSPRGQSLFAAAAPIWLEYQTITIPGLEGM